MRHNVNLLVLLALAGSRPDLRQEDDPVVHIEAAPAVSNRPVGPFDSSLLAVIPDRCVVVHLVTLILNISGVPLIRRGIAVFQVDLQDLAFQVGVALNIADCRMVE